MTALLRFWCRLMHSPYSLTRPVRGRYRCMVCLSEFTAPWAAEPEERAAWRDAAAEESA